MTHRGRVSQLAGPQPRRFAFVRDPAPHRSVEAVSGIRLAATTERQTSSSS